jgi:hypothetical protein
MSYIRAKKVDQEEPVTVEYGFRIQEVGFNDHHSLDMNLDDEMLAFVLGLIKQVDELAEGEALVVWKEIF